MRRRRITALAFGLVLILSLISPAWANADEMEADLALLRDAVDAHPEDPDLVWAYARKLAASGRATAAVGQTRRFLSRWPERRPAARVEIARVLIDIGATAEAMPLLDEAVSADPRSGVARFYRALAFRSEGSVRAANREFRLAARLEPAFRGESLLARALGLFETGQEQEAVALLLEVLRLDPTGDTAMRARLLLRQREIPSAGDRFRADAYVGFEWDDNVTLENAENEVPASNRDDVRGVWGFGGSWRAWGSDRGALTVGYRYDQTEHHELGTFDLISNQGFVSGTWRAGKQVALRLDAIGYNTLQDLDNELSGGLIRPNVLVSFGPVWGALRLFAEVELAEYHDRPLLEPWDRDAIAFGVGLEHFFPLPATGSWLALSGSWERTRTQAGTGGFAGGFDGDFDYDSWRARALARFELPFDLRMRVETSYTYDRFHNDNFSHAIATLGGIRKREDDILRGRLALSRAIVDHVRLEVYWRGTRRLSNVDLFDYDKQVVGAVLRFSTD